MISNHGQIHPNTASHMRLQLKCDGTRWRTGGEVKGKLANAVGSQYSSHYLGTWCIQHYYRGCAQLGLSVVEWTDAPAELNGLVRFGERRNSGFCACAITFNLLKPNDIYICRTAALTFRRYILYIYSTNIHTKYFKHAA